MVEAAKPRLRIAVLHRNFTQSGGGAEHYAVAMVEALAAQHEFHVFAQKIEHRVKGVSYTKIPHWFEKPRFLNQLIYATFVAWHTRRGFDIVHSHENTWCGNVQTVHVLPLSHQLFAGKPLWRRALKCLSVATSPRLLTYWLLEKFRFWPRADRYIVAVSEPLRRVMVDSLNCSAERVVTIAPGVDVPPSASEPIGKDTHTKTDSAKTLARAALGIRADAHVLLWVGNDAQKKGLSTALAALAQLPQDYLLVVAGAANPQASWQHLLTPELKRRVVVLGVVKNMAQLYSAGDALVHPTLEDTFGMVVLEAMAHGLPVVVSNDNYCGVAASLTDEHNALILQNPKNALEMAQKIEHLFDANFYASLANNAKSWAQTQSWEVLSKQQNRLYWEIVTKSHD